MQTSKVKAEALGRKAKVPFQPPLPYMLPTTANSGPLACPVVPRASRVGTPTSMQLPTIHNPLTRRPAQRVLEQGPQVGRKLYPGSADRQGVVWQGLSRHAQAHKWLQGAPPMATRLPRSRLTLGIGRPQVGQQGRLEPRARDPPPSSVCPPAYRPPVRGHSDGDSGVVGVGILPRYDRPTLVATIEL